VTTMNPELIAAERLSRVDELDLEPVIFKLLHPEPGSPRPAVDAAERDAELYRCFLKLCVIYPGQAIVPTHDIDHVWHAHVLDTAKYRTDCDRVFGRPLDHFPYAGLRGPQDRAAWSADFARTRVLFAEHFGIDIGGSPAASACTSHVGGADCCVGCITSAASFRPRPARRPPEA
jgi:hypothetical protein